MIAPSRFFLLLPLALALGAGIARPVQSQTLVTRRADLPSHDPVDWAVLGENVYPLSNPFRLNSSQGTALTVSQSGGAFGTLRQAGSPLAEGALLGNFAPGDAVLEAPDGGAVSLAFAHGVYGGGAQLAVPAPTPSGAGPFTVQVRAFGRDGALLASFTRSGTFSARADNSAPFVGIVDGAPDIYRISYTATTPHGGVFLNRFDIATAPPAPPAAHAHLLWNNVDGRVMLWSIARDGGVTLNGFGPYTDGAPQNKWSATALATGPDGLSHLLWNNTDGSVMLWTVDDAGHVTSHVYGPPASALSVPHTTILPQNKWSATAISVGPDNVTHLLWNNTDHRVMLWNVDQAFNFTSARFGPYTDDFVSSSPANLWSATALATGPDNVSRIAWNNADRRVMLWTVDKALNVASITGYGPYTDDFVSHDPGNLWSAVGVSVGPDNVTHLLWGNVDRRMMLWDIARDGGVTLAGFGPYTDDSVGRDPSVNLWRAVALATGPDGLSHVLWGNTDYRAMLWGVDSAFNVPSIMGYGPYTDDFVSRDPGNLWSATAVSAGP